MSAERTFPVLVQGDHEIANAVRTPRSVPWSWIAPHEARARRNHGQSLQRLAERGGLGALEMWAVIHDKGLWENADDWTEAANRRAHEWLATKPWERPA